jgi:hypothetical protein
VSGSSGGRNVARNSDDDVYRKVTAVFVDLVDACSTSGQSGSALMSQVRLGDLQVGRTTSSNFTQ